MATRRETADRLRVGDRFITKYGTRHTITYVSVPDPKVRVSDDHGWNMTLRRGDYLRVERTT